MMSRIQKRLTNQPSTFSGPRPANAVSFTLSDGIKGQSLRMIASTIFVLLALVISTAAIAEPVLEKQVLMRNSIWLESGQNANGASAVLVQTSWGPAAVTARHLLGPAMGINPEIRPSQLPQKLDSWRLIRPRTSTQPLALFADVDKLAFPPKDTNRRDLLVFSLKQTISDLDTRKAQVLKISKETPQRGDTHYLIGCPYAERECVQNMYAITFSGSMRSFAHTFPGLNFSLSGFSGAPIINRRGELLGILTGLHGTTLLGERITQQCVDDGKC